MRNTLLATAALALALPLSAQDETPAPSPGLIVAAAPDSEWVAIPAEDLLVMTLAPDADGKQREVVIQLMPPPFSQGWISNIRTLARANWYDGISVNRVQDNYVVQWGDPNYDNPEADGEEKTLPEGLRAMEETAYNADYDPALFDSLWYRGKRAAVMEILPRPPATTEPTRFIDPYSDAFSFVGAFPVGVSMNRPRSSPLISKPEKVWPVHCYGMVGVGRNYSPDTGSGAELYTVIGQAPRHLDRNIALVGRIVSGMEHLSSLPRGTGALGFYTEDEFDKRTPILTVRVASDLPEADQPNFEFLDTESESFARYAEARANRRDPFFIVPAGGADVCNIPVPTRTAAAE